MRCGKKYRKEMIRACNWRKMCDRDKSRNSNSPNSADNAAYKEPESKLVLHCQLYWRLAAHVMHHYFKETQVLINVKFLLYCILFSDGVTGLKITGTSFDIVLIWRLNYNQ